MDPERPQSPTGDPGSAAPAPETGTPAAADAPASQGSQALIDAARERLAKGERLIPGTSGESQVGPEDEPPGDEPTGDAPPAEAQGTPPEGDETPPEETPPEGEDTPPEEPTGEETEGFTVTLEGLEERGEQPIELEAPDEESFNRLNRLQNEATIGRQVKQERRQIQRAQQDLMEVEDMIAIDPTGFVLERVSETVRTDVAMQLLFQPQVLQAIEERLSSNEAIAELLGEEEGQAGLASVLGNRLALRTLRAELEAGRLKMQGELRTQHETRRAMQQNAQSVAVEIDRLIPETITGEQRELLFRDALRDVKERITRLGLKQIDPQDVQLMVSDRFRRQGIDLSANGNRGTPRGSAPAPTAAPKGKTAEQLKRDRDLKRAAAATAPPGAGAPAAKPRPDLPKGTAERIKLARKLGLRALLGRT